MKLRVAVVEAQALFTPFLLNLFPNGDFDIVYASEGVDEREIAGTAPEIVLIDIDFMTRDAIITLRSLRSGLPNATICAYTGQVEARWAAALVRAGANCVMSKSASSETVVDGIIRAVRVGSFIDEHFDTSPEA